MSSWALLYSEIIGFYIIPFILASLMGVYGGLTVMLGILCPNVGSPVLVGHHSICHRHFALGFLGEGTLSSCCSSPRVWRAAKLSASPFLQHSAPQRAVHLSTTFKFRITQSNLSRVCCLLIVTFSNLLHPLEAMVNERFNSSHMFTIFVEFVCTYPFVNTWF